ncbi:PSD1 and planctomycete cytochrome C domain-containing protein [Marinoscillum furvescens]|uniref:Cytochrome c n=1 Tax=Marinoscillum furvescens DSM 4134 TaxID=1122208 RepID=A0A3D9L549_MARFU|nr:PSD1 and planctomycete cytochrome C domain-containing protein [Marinoscillum furvescens]REE00212.1 cytochrome c [Marinoscillum furvescens DSM 4134]
MSRQLLALCTLVSGLYFTSCDQGFTSEAGLGELPEVLDYNIHVRPILSDKCFVCHGPDANKRESGLRLDTKEGAYAALKDQPNVHAIVPGDPASSAVYQRITAEDATMLMPPAASNLKLTEREIQIIEKWIAQGAEYKKHWAFVPPKPQPLPEVKQESWPVNAIDFFVLKQMESMGLEPNEQADKARLLRRVAFDLTGLPPSLELQERFMSDDSDEAYAKVVDELLTSKHYGEKIAIHWLDVARYADSHGYQDDGLRTMWPWRDWVIHAFNENYPYDQFLTWQLAGDLLPEHNVEAILATGFNRNHKITQEGGVIDEEYRIEYVTDRTNTFGKAFLGLTFECAKCHDHKYDPISQKDYFSTFAFFDKVPEKGIFGTFDASFADPPNMRITDEYLEDVLSFINKKDDDRLDVMVMKDSVGLRTTHVLTRGNYDAKAEVVYESMPKAVMPFDTTRFAQNRKGLAEWLLSTEHPLTSRVFVNRIWQEIFGIGIVKTAGDFGMQGDLPTHPELLDWLALDFQKDWDIKRLVKQIVTSATYRQSGEVTEKKLRLDPENTYLARYSRSRLPAELIRDMVLASSGLLNSEVGGPSVKPYQPDGLWSAATSGRGMLQEYIQDHGEDLYRRGIYTFIKRTVPPPVMLTFDASSRDQCEVRRLTTSTPLQALVILNDPTILEGARVLAERLVSTETDDEEKVVTAFRRIVCRYPKNEEHAILMGYLKDLQLHFHENQEEAKAFISVGEYPKSKELNATAVAALMQVIHTIYNMEETITKS